MSFLPFVAESQVKLYLAGLEEVSSLPYDEVCSSKSRKTRKRTEDKTKTRKEPELDCHSSSWSSKDIMAEWKHKPQDGRRYYSTYNWQRAHIWNSYKQTRDNPIEKWAGLINRYFTKGDIQINMGKCWISLVMREMQWKQMTFLNSSRFCLLKSLYFLPSVPPHSLLKMEINMC